MRQNEAVETVKEIRGMMERSSRFMSFSGTSAILIGLYALAGSFFTHRLLLSIKDVSVMYPMLDWAAVFPDVVLVAMIVLMLSLLTILFFSMRKAKKMNQSFINGPALRTFLNFFLPFIAGGIFVIALFNVGSMGMIVPSMLLFYGLSLINASKYTNGSIFWLGCCEVLLGLICAFYPEKGLLYWSIGFGVLHIVYGIYFYFRIERNSAI